MPAEKHSVFIGNIPYGLTEEQIVHLFSSVGQVLNFRLVYDKDTGRPKGFGFAEFTDADAAASAVRNLNDHEIMGRKLRVDYSNDAGGGGNDSAPSNYNQHTQVANGPEPVQPTQLQLPPLPPGADLQPGLTCPDAISRTLSALPAPQLLDILSQMKGLVMSDPSKATELLKQAPQLSYAIFQALLLLGLVDTTVLAQVVDQPSQQPSMPQIPQQQPNLPPPPQHLPSQYQPLPPRVMHVPTPPIQHTAYQPPSQQQQLPPPQPPQPPSIDRNALLQQVINMPQHQIDTLGPNERAQIMALRQQIMSGQQVF